nr:beta-L-arabinofuranosidase domain-containing protein [Proteiniphilum saccharofermentans]
MKKHTFILFFSVLGCIITFFPPKSMAQPVQVKTSVPDLLLNGDPSNIKIGDHLGERIDICVEQRVKGQDVNHLIVPFYNKTETHRWQSEFWGKWMLGAVLSYRYTQDPVLLDSIQKGVKDLLGSQLPNGYIGNYSEEAQLQQWDVWGRKYSMLGLLSYYDLTGDKEVLKACRKMADHLMTQVGPGKTNIVTTGNYMGMASSSILEPIVFLYRRTGDARYLDFAKYIVAQWETSEGPGLISKAEAGVPVAERFPHPVTIQQAWFGTHNGQKAYEMMSCYEGLLELYKLTNDPQYLSAVEKTVQSIIDTEINIAGSGSAFECWYYGKPQQARPTYHTMETCVTMTWMKLCQTLLNLTGNPVYADQMEITAYNALLASMKDDGSQIAKYSPLEGQRHPGEEQCGMHINCCNANGPRAFALLPQFAVMPSANNNEVYINLYTGFTSTVPLTTKKKVVIKQETNYPADGKIRLQIETDKPEDFTVGLRIPSWSKNNSVAVNGEKIEGVNAGMYCKINRQWKKGDVITLDLDVRGRVVKQDGYAAVMKGPVVLARDSRFCDGFVDETAQIVHNDNYVELTPSQYKLKGIWMSFTAPLVLGTDLEGEARSPKQIHFCDFASAGNTWMNDVRYRVWITETLNVRNEPYEPYNIE